MMTVLVGFSGFAVDLQRSWLVQTRLKTAIDAAALVAARDFDNPDLNANVRAAFISNVNAGGSGMSAFGATFSDLVIDKSSTDRTVTISATATVPKTLFRVIASGDIIFTERSSATTTTRGLELAMVFDASRSMGELVPGTTTTKLEAAKTAMGVLLQTLYGDADTRQNLYVSLVPFSTHVNIGTSAGARQLLNTTNPPMPTAFTFDGGNAWTGCVEARTTFGDYDINDAAPTTDAGKYRPYFWPSTYRQVGTVEQPQNGNTCQLLPSGSTRSTRGTYYPAGQRANGVNVSDNVCYGDNDWGSPELTEPDQLDTITSSGGIPRPRNPAYSANYVDGIRPSAGPNLYCIASKILPLTASRRSINTAMTPMAPADGRGTIVVAGMHAAWLTLAPNWRGFWPGIASTALPRDYGLRDNRKVIILLTDGKNNWEAFFRVTGGVNPERSRGELYYTGYGRAATPRAPAMTFDLVAPPVTGTETTVNAEGVLNSRLVELCRAIKQSGVVIYVIGYEADSGGDTWGLKQCSSDPPDTDNPNYYFSSPTAATLNGIFQKIANRLTTLRLTQ